MSPRQRRGLSPRPRSPQNTPEARRIRGIFAECTATHIAVFARETRTIERMARLVADTVKRGRTVFFCGNGGSAAEAQHLATELAVRFVKDRRALPAMALGTDTALLTAAGNDYGFERVFARQLEALGRRGDLLIAMTTSGRSSNVLEAVRAARSRGMRVAGMTGEAGRSFARLCDVALVVPSRETARIQEVHLLVGHICCERAENGARGATGPRPTKSRRKKTRR